MDEAVAKLWQAGEPVWLTYWQTDGTEVIGRVTDVVSTPDGSHYDTIMCVVPPYLVKLLLSKVEGDPFVVADYYPAEGEAVVWVGSSSSHCSACGGNASTSEASHIHGGQRGMWSEGSSLDNTNGCGVKWTRRVLVYIGPDDSKLNLTDMSKPMDTWKWPTERSDHESSSD